MKRKTSPTTPAKTQSTNVSLYFEVTIWRDIKARAKHLDMSASQYLRGLARKDIEAAA